jgi:hypothetical protein
MDTNIIHSKMPITSKSRAKKVVARYPARQRSKPERFSDVQLSLTVGISKDTYVRKYVQCEKITDKNKKPDDSKLAGYVSDGGFVLGDNEGLDCDSEEEDEEEMEFDDDSEEDEELELED